MHLRAPSIDHGVQAFLLGARVLSVPLVRDACGRRHRPDRIRALARGQRADLLVRADPRRRRPRSAAPLASLSGRIRRGACCAAPRAARLRARTSSPASSAPTRSSSTRLRRLRGRPSDVSARTCARRRLSPSAPMCRVPVSLADWSSAQPADAAIPRRKARGPPSGRRRPPVMPTTERRSRALARNRPVRVRVGRGGPLDRRGSRARRRRGVETEAEDEPEPEREHRQERPPMSFTIHRCRGHSTSS